MNERGTGWGRLYVYQGSNDPRLNVDEEFRGLLDVELIESARDACVKAGVIEKDQHAAKVNWWYSDSVNAWLCLVTLNVYEDSIPEF